MKKLFVPHFMDSISKRTMMIIAAIQIFLLFSICQFNGNEVLPKPLGVFSALSTIVTDNTFLDDLFATFGLVVQGMVISIGISIFLIYLSTIPAFNGIIKFVSKLRFLTYTGLLFVFTILLKDAHQIKISLLLFGIIPYFVTSLLSYVGDIKKSEYELCTSLKFSVWQTLYEVIIKGKLHVVLEVIRQNFAICWMLITSVEGISMAEGGLGTMMLKANKFVKMDQVFAVLLIILTIGIFFDYIFDVLKVWWFPYTATKRNANLWINRFIFNTKK